MRFRFIEKTKIPQLPKSPGVYAFKKGVELLYVGKAANIRERVKNHFQQPDYRDNLFINQVEKIGYIKTNSEFAESSVHLTSHPASQGSTIEALILEANLIKKYQPKYNIAWRDDKNYFYIGITKGDFPQVFIAHQPKLQTKYVGPFVDGKALKETLKVLRKVFPYRSCKSIPKRPCLWYQLGRCPAPCLLRTKLGQQIPVALSQIKNESQRNARNLMKILQGEKNQVLKNLKKEMKKASDLEDYEKAAKIRNQIAALEKVLAHAKIFEPQPVQKIDWPQIQKTLQGILKTKETISRIEAYDISNIQGEAATGSLVTFTGGLPDKNFYRKFKIKIAGKPNDIAMIKEVLKRRLKHLEWGLPGLILIDGGKAQLNAAKLTINNYHLTIPVIALVKKRNELFIGNQKNPILLKNLPREIFNLILQLRDESHRFAISYHRKLRAMTLLK